MVIDGISRTLAEENVVQEKLIAADIITIWWSPLELKVLLLKYTHDTCQQIYQQFYGPK